jgi:hypothetical protein
MEPEAGERFEVDWGHFGALEYEADKKWGADVATEREARGGDHQILSQLGPRQGASLWGLRHRAEPGCGQCRRHTRRGRACRGKHPAMVEIGRAQELSIGRAITHPCRCCGEQRKSPARLETPLTAVGGSDPDTDHGLSLSSGNQQVEQDRAPAILVY